MWDANFTSVDPRQTSVHSIWDGGGVIEALDKQGSENQVMKSVTGKEKGQHSFAYRWWSLPADGAVVLVLCGDRIY